MPTHCPFQSFWVDGISWQQFDTKCFSLGSSLCMNVKGAVGVPLCLGIIFWMSDCSLSRHSGRFMNNSESADSYCETVQVNVGFCLTVLHDRPLKCYITLASWGKVFKMLLKYGKKNCDRLVRTETFESNAKLFLAVAQLAHLIVCVQSAWNYPSSCGHTLPKPKEFSFIP